MIVLNSIMADQLNSFYDEVQNEVSKGVKRDEAIFRILRKYIKATKNIIF